jgi:hypothetical protein
MAPNGTITITVIARISLEVLPDQTLTFHSSAAGFQGQVASALFRLKVTRRGVDFQPTVSVSSGLLEIEIQPNGQASFVSKETPIAPGEVVERPNVVLLRVDVVNVGDATNNSPFHVVPILPANSDAIRTWPGCADFPNASNIKFSKIPPREKVSLCQAFRIFSFREPVSMAVRINCFDDDHKANDQSTTESFSFGPTRIIKIEDGFFFPETPVTLQIRGR